MCGHLPDRDPHGMQRSVRRHHEHGDRLRLDLHVVHDHGPQRAARVRQQPVRDRVRPRLHPLQGRLRAAEYEHQLRLLRGLLQRRGGHANLFVCRRRSAGVRIGLPALSESLRRRVRRRADRHAALRRVRERLHDGRCERAPNLRGGHVRARVRQRVHAMQRRLHPDDQRPEQLRDLRARVPRDDVDLLELHVRERMPRKHPHVLRGQRHVRRHDERSGQLQRVRREVLDERRQRPCDLPIERLRICLQRRLHGLQRRLRERADRPQQLRRVRLRTRLRRRRELSGGHVHVRGVGVRSVPAPPVPLLQDEHGVWLQDAPHRLPVGAWGGPSRPL